MKSQKNYRKFQFHQKNIEELEKQNSRFRRVYSEYQNISSELRNIENTRGNSVPDDFISAMEIQNDYLEEEIEDILNKYLENKQSHEIKNQ